MRALRVLFLLLLREDRLLLAPLALEAGIIAAPEGKLRLIEMEDMVGDGIKEVAIVADDEDRRRIARQIVDEPERAFEIEIIGRLVEEQQVRRRKEHRRQRHAHPPAAGKFREWAALRLVIEAQTGKNMRRARRRGMGVDVDKAGLDFSDAMRIGRRFGLDKQSGALNIGGEDEVEEGRRAAGRFLLDAAEPHLLRHRDRARIGRQIAGDHIEQRGLASAVAADEADPRPFGESGCRLVEEDAGAEPVGQFTNMKHRRVLTRCSEDGKPKSSGLPVA